MCPVDNNRLPNKQTFPTVNHHPPQHHPPYAHTTAASPCLQGGQWRGKQQQNNRRRPSTSNCATTTMTRGRWGRGRRITTTTTTTTGPPTAVASNCSLGENGEQEGRGWREEVADTRMTTGTGKRRQRGGGDNGVDVPGQRHDPLPCVSCGGGFFFCSNYSALHIRLNARIFSNCLSWPNMMTNLTKFSIRFLDHRFKKNKKIWIVVLGHAGLPHSPQ